MQRGSDSPERTNEPIEPIDSAPLSLEQLSDHELLLILQIESRLRDVQCTLQKLKLDGTASCRPAPPFLASPETRYRRTLLLDGARGTGKTSLLLTMIHRWTPSNTSGVSPHDPKICEKRIQALYERGLANREEPLNPKSPENIVVVGHILDFDPLPPAVPLIAGIVQAWHPIVDQFDDVLEDIYKDAVDDEDSTLVDLWHRLFQIAAVGWTDLPPVSGLIEQVLDRQEQVGDWHKLDRSWKEFIERLTASGTKCPSHKYRLSEKTVYVVMIDDVDLQVGRIRQLLPALRMLYDKRVVFLVAADREHMAQMLRADFYGQQGALARHHNARPEPLNDLIRDDPWSAELARSSIEKVFARRNRWELRRLSLKEFLEFPRDTPGASQERTLPVGEHATFFDYLQSISCAPSTVKSTDRGRSENDSQGKSNGNKNRASEGAGVALQRLANAADERFLSGVMTYRTATQLYEYIQGERVGTKGGARVLAQVLSASGEGGQAKVLEDGSIYLPVRGQIAALHRPGPTILAGNHSLVLSARPDFVYLDNGSGRPLRISSEDGRRLNSTGLLAAKMLEELDYPVDASALTWDTFLSHAWTEWFLGAKLSFAWTRPFHPRPDEHLKQVKSWARFVDVQRGSKGESGDEEQQERWAYAWIYYQLEWRRSTQPEEVQAPKELAEGEDLKWKDLRDRVAKYSAKAGEHKWRRNTLPLLARPELGFPSKVQEMLLGTIEQDDQAKRVAMIKDLKRDRRRWVTDAFVHGDIQQGGTGDTLPRDDEVEQIIQQIDQSYREGHEGENYWEELVEREAREMSKGASVESEGV